MSLDTFFTQMNPYLVAFDEVARQYKLSGHATIDHIGYKCGSFEEYSALRALFEKKSWLYQSPSSDRSIAIIQLPIAQPSILGPIRLLQLADQKPDSSQRQGFSHIDIYPKGRPHISLRNLVNYCERKGLQLEKGPHAHHLTYEAQILDGFKLRAVAEPMYEKVARNIIESMVPKAQ